MSYIIKRAYYPQKIFEQPENDLGIVIVIPAFLEPDLLKSLNALRNCISPDCAVEIIIVINQSVDIEESSSEITKELITKTSDWICENSKNRLRYYLISACDLPSKIAGVGLARKIGMDEAVRRFEISGNSEGVICCFDADSSCDDNYFIAIEDHFRRNSKSTGCSIYFEHPLSGNEFSTSVYEGIMNYELHLRYYISGLQFAGHPFAYHTIGSSMAVRADIYQKQGGMNKRKAGEDFYFLHKIIPLGHFTELNTTRIIPSPRPSDRVPFGTGRAINNWLDNKTNVFFSYHPSIFKELKSFLDLVDSLYAGDEEVIKKFSKPVTSFLIANDFNDKLKEIKQNSTDMHSFRKRFFKWFDGFKTLKFVHYMRDHYFPNIKIDEASLELLNMQKEKVSENKGIVDILMKYREKAKI